MKVLITSGGTKIKIDRVRDITNMSKGTFGAKIAEQYLQLKHNVVFMKAKYSKTPMTLEVNVAQGHTFPTPQDYKYWVEEREAWLSNYTEYEYTTYEQYAEMLKFVIGVEQPDMILLAAAVSDYGIENYFDGKIRSNDMLTLRMCQLPKIISHVREWAPKAKLVGFKLLVNSKELDLLVAAQRSLADNQLDLVVANDLQDILDNNHKVHLVTKDKIETFQAKNSEDPDYLARMLVRKTFTL